MEFKPGKAGFIWLPGSTCSPKESWRLQPAAGIRITAPRPTRVLSHTIQDRLPEGSSFTCIEDPKANSSKSARGLIVVCRLHGSVGTQSARLKTTWQWRPSSRAFRRTCHTAADGTPAPNSRPRLSDGYQFSDGSKSNIIERNQAPVRRTPAECGKQRAQQAT